MTLQQGDTLFAVSFNVNDIENIHNIPIRKSEFEVVDIVNESVLSKSKDSKFEFSCMTSEMNFFHPASDNGEEFSGMFTSEDEIIQGFRKLYKDKVSSKLNDLFDKEFKNESQK